MMGAGRLSRLVPLLAAGCLLFSAGATGAAVDAASDWKSLQSRLGAGELVGVHESERWIFSCYRQPIDPNSRGFENVELAACKEEAMVELVRHCTGAGPIGDGLASPLPQVLEQAYASWYSGRVRTAGSIWVESRRIDGYDIAVVAMSRHSCLSMPKRSDWRKSALAVAGSSSNWLVAASLAEDAAPADRSALLEIAAERLDAAVNPVATAWPEALVRLPDVLPSDRISALDIGDLSRLAAIRPGDRGLWAALSQRCRDLGLEQVAATVEATPTRLGWPNPAPIEKPHAWASVATDGLPPALVAVVRLGGAIPVNPAEGGADERSAMKAFSAGTPDLVEAEARARDACSGPNANALNLLAAIRLADSGASDTELLQALAFARQAVAIDARHPFAAVNVARALKRLGWRAHARAALAALPEHDEGSWQRREAARIEEWLAQD